MIDATDRGDEWVMGRFDFGGLSARIERAVKEVGAERLVLDPLDGLFVGFGDPSEVRRALHGMSRALRPLKVTTVLTAERVEDYGPLTRFGVEEFVADNLVVLRNALSEERRRRTLEVVKFRGYQHRKGEFPFIIDPLTGVEVVPFSAAWLSARLSRNDNGDRTAWVMASVDGKSGKVPRTSVSSR